MRNFLSNPRASRRFAINLAIVAGVFVTLYAMTHASQAAAALGLDPSRHSLVMFELGVIGSMLLLLALVFRLMARQCRHARAVYRLHGAQRGTVMVEFTLVFPIIMLIMGMVVQIALIANASLVVRYAAFMSARTAVVTFSRSFLGIQEDLDNEPERIEKTAELILASISPVTAGTDRDAQALLRIHRRQNGPWGSRTLPQRMRYSQIATTVTTDDEYPPADLGFFSLPNFLSPKQVTVTVRYEFLITLPGLYSLPPFSIPSSAAPDGLGGRAIVLEHSVTMQSTGSRVGHPLSFWPLPPEGVLP